MNTKRLILKQTKANDPQSILQYLNKNKSFFQQYEPIRSNDYYTIDYWQQKLAHDSQLSFEEVGHQYFVYLKDEPNIAIGSIHYANVIRGAFQSCTLGYALDEDCQGHGYMAEALAKSIETIFTQYNLHRIMANYLVHNARSANLLQKLGFTIEGRAKDYLYINGQWQDHVLTSLINVNWHLKNN